MIYTEQTKKALKLCFEAHKDQLDKSGLPYVFHPFHLAEQMTDERTTVVALLHDVVEDTDYTLDDLRAMGFPKEAIEALTLLTHDPAVPYLDYVAKIKKNSIARAVKLADLRHNSDLSRLDVIDEKALERGEKYKKAIALLQDCEEDTANLIRELYSITDRLDRKYRADERKFTPDGHLIGSIGEVLVAEAYNLKLCKSSTKDYDAVTKDSRGIKVQIKATQTERVSLSSVSSENPPYLIVIQIHPPGKCTLVYNGPGEPAWAAAGKPQKNGQRQISLARLRDLSASVSKDEQIPMLASGLIELL